MVLSLVYARRRTMELSYAGPMTHDNPGLHGKPEALPGVGSSDLVRPCNHRLMSVTKFVYSAPLPPGLRPVNRPMASSFISCHFVAVVE